MCTFHKPEEQEPGAAEQEEMKPLHCYFIFNVFGEAYF